MSYARLGPDSDVYLTNGGDVVDCVWCQLHGDFTARRSQMIEHLQRHVEAGHKVPGYAFERLAREADQERLGRLP